MIEEEKPMTTGWGKSLAVPSVQEIVRKDVKDVPERYIQNEEDRPKASEISLLSSEIPIINLSLLENGDEDELRKLDFASREWGFFQVIDHGVRDEVLQNMKAAVASFFELPCAKSDLVLGVSPHSDSSSITLLLQEDEIAGQTKARISVATFVIPEDQVDIEPVETMVDDRLLPRKYKSVKYVDFLRYSLARKMDGKSHTDYLKL